MPKQREKRKTRKKRHRHDMLVVGCERKNHRLCERKKVTGARITFHVRLPLTTQSHWFLRSLFSQVCWLLMLLRNENNFVTTKKAFVTNKETRSLQTSPNENLSKFITTETEFPINEETFAINVLPFSKRKLLL